MYKNCTIIRHLFTEIPTPEHLNFSGYQKLLFNHFVIVTMDLAEIHCYGDWVQ